MSGERPLDDQQPPAEQPPSETGWGDAAAGMNQPFPTQHPYQQAYPGHPGTPQMGYGMPPGSGGVPVLEGTIFVEGEVAGWWRRIGGTLLDLVIYLLIMAIPFALWIFALHNTDANFFSAMTDLFVAADSESEAAMESSITDVSALSGNVWLVLLAGSIVLWAYYLCWNILWLRSKKQARPGQRILGFVVVDRYGQRISRGQAWGRCLFKVLPSFLGILGWALQGSSLITIGVTKKKQAVHDLASGVLCVRIDALEARRAQFGGQLMPQPGTDPGVQ